VPPRRAALRRLANEVRRLIAAVVTSRAEQDDLERCASQVSEVADALEALPSGSAYEGVAEAALAGADAEIDAHLVYDHSPLIGEASPLAPPVRIEIVEDHVVGTVTFSNPYEGPPGFVHGGYIAAMFDEVLGAAQCLSGTAGMTAHLGVDYRQPTPLNVELRLEGRLDRVEGRKVFVSGTCWHEGQVTSEANGLFITFDADRFSAMRAARNEASDGPDPA